MSTPESKSDLSRSEALRRLTMLDTVTTLTEADRAGMAASRKAVQEFTANILAHADQEGMLQSSEEAVGFVQRMQLLKDVLCLGFVLPHVKEYKLSTTPAESAYEAFSEAITEITNRENFAPEVRVEVNAQFQKIHEWFSSESGACDGIMSRAPGDSEKSGSACAPKVEGAAAGKGEDV